MVGAVGKMASMKRRKLWKTGQDGLCCSSSAIQTRLGPPSLLEERSKTPIGFDLCVVGYPPSWGKQPRYREIVNSCNNHLNTFTDQIQSLPVIQQSNES